MADNIRITKFMREVIDFYRNTYFSTSESGSITDGQVIEIIVRDWYMMCPDKVED